MAAHAVDTHASPGEHHTSTGISNTKLGMWVFLGSECLFFGALISTYLLYRGRGDGPYLADVYDIPFTSVSSFVLLMSSLAMVLAVAAVYRGDERRMRIWLVCTALLGMVFIGGQIFEFTEFVREGLKLDTNLSGTTFFVLTGFHGVHVTVGILWLLSLTGYSLRRGIGPEKAVAVDIAGLYWHFVDVVWIVIFTVIYLVPQ
ncbi:MAG TPA: cytochrome c oxidase subunit 3 [Acidimicrobiia bacterium]|nr:cytochrome c oxidase subunit 3 [Acidimicrobiia bacterium]